MTKRLDARRQRRIQIIRDCPHADGCHYPSCPVTCEGRKIVDASGRNVIDMHGVTGSRPASASPSVPQGNQSTS